MRSRLVLAFAAVIVCAVAVLAAALGTTDPLRCAAIEAIGSCAALAGFVALGPASPPRSR